MSNVREVGTKVTHHFLERTHTILEEARSPSVLCIGGFDIRIKDCNKMSANIP